MQAKSIGADALRRFFSGMLDKLAPVKCPRCQATETDGDLCDHCWQEWCEEGEQRGETS